MRAGRLADMPALVELWRTEVREGRRDSVPRTVDLDRLLAHFDWAAQSRVVDEPSGGLAGAVLVTRRAGRGGTLARIDPASAGQDAGGVLAGLVRWAIQLARAAGAAAAQVWLGRGQPAPLQSLGLTLVRHWWRMDRTLSGELPPIAAVTGYSVVDGSRLPRSSWAGMHNRSFADHWDFRPRGEQELLIGKSPRLCLMAVTAETGQPAAVTLCQLETYSPDLRPQPVGLVSSVGTLPEHRRRGLASWLVAEGLIRLRDEGARHASLYVDARNHTRAFDGYRKLGFERAFETEVWEASFS